MKIVLNGDPREVGQARTIAELVTALRLPAPVTLIEHNGFALRRSEWPLSPLAEGDRIEVVRFVAGG